MISHCYSRDQPETPVCKDRGFFISGVMTKSAQSESSAQPEMVRQIPDRQPEENASAAETRATVVVQAVDQRSKDLLRPRFDRL